MTPSTDSRDINHVHLRPNRVHSKQMAKRKVKFSRSPQTAKNSPLIASASTDKSAASVSAGAGGGFPVVGFGASAGGLEAFTQVLTHLSTTTGMAFVLVTHLDPKRESMLAEILSRSTRMPVTEVRRSTAVEPNHVYVAPPGTDIRLEKRVLHLSPYIPKGVPHMAVDYFFRSLAQDLGNNAIGVILSGTGTDGSYGSKAIKAEGGITFSQDENSAKHDGMLRSAIVSGAVDFVLPPDKIADELARLGSHPYVAPPKPAAPEDVIPVPEAALSKILHRIHRATGVDLSQYKPNTIKRRILRRTLLVKAESLDAYVTRLEDDPEEVQALYEDMLINVTQFFREPGCFDALKTDVFPNIAGQGADSVRIWVPGCSTGEEVYTLAICLLEYLEDRQHQMQIQIFGTEISDQALTRARVGSYSEGITTDVSPERLKKFFIKSDRGYQIAKRIRDLCIFARQNLAKDAPFSRLDLISCRNVLIYLGAELQKRILPVFHYALKPAGYLLLGNSENITSHSDMFSLVDKKHRIFVTREAPTRLPAGFNYGPSKAEAKQAPNLTVKRDSTETPSELHKEADRLILSRYGPPGVIISGDLEVIQFRGQTGAYLEPAPGPASYNILKMARQGLMAELRSAIQRALRDDSPIRSEGLRVKHNGAYETFDLEVIPLRRSPQRGRFLMVLFHPLKAGGPKKEQTQAALRRIKDGPSQQIQRLEEELSSTKESLQAIIEEQEASNEELRSANEEIQSSNEELQSTNEELETAKEELQSSNEELNTVNEELENRNVQLAQANDDLRNLLSSVNIPIVMVSSDLRIRRFTPQAEKVLSIIAAIPAGQSQTSAPTSIFPTSSSC